MIERAVVVEDEPAHHRRGDGRCGRRDIPVNQATPHTRIARPIRNTGCRDGQSVIPEGIPDRTEIPDAPGITGRACDSDRRGDQIGPGVADEAHIMVVEGGRIDIL